MAKLAHKVRVIQGLLGGDTARMGPLYVSVAVTRRCNLHCVGCIFHSPDVESPFFQRHNIPELLFRYRIGPAVWEKMPCYVGWFHSFVGVDGDVLPCCTCARPMGSLQVSRFPAIWNNEAYRAFRRQTATREGLAAAGDTCRCHYCSYVGNNHRVHRTLRWLSPFSMVARRRPLPGAM